MVVVILNPFTLKYSDSATERQYRQHQQRTCRTSHSSTWLWLHLVAGVLNAVYSCMRVEGILSSSKHAWVAVPYLMIAVGHCFVVLIRAYAHSSRLQQVLLYRLVSESIERVYVAVCTFTIPWSLFGGMLEVKSYTQGILASSDGLCLLLNICVLLSIFASKSWPVDSWAIPLGFLALGWYINPKVCTVADNTPMGQSIVKAISTVLNHSNMLACAKTSCRSLMILWQFACCIFLWYFRYRMERTKRVNFLQPSHIMRTRPAPPPVIQVLLHVAVFGQILGVAWVCLQCSNV